MGDLNPFSALAAKIYGGLAVVLILACAGLWMRGNYYAADRDAWKSAASAQKSAVAATQAAAKAKAIAASIATENRYAELARRADNAEATVADLRTAADRFAAARGLCSSISGDASGRAGGSSENGPSPYRDGPGADAVVLTRPEFDDFVSNSLRLERVRQWGQSLILDGLAIPEADFGRVANDGRDGARAVPLATSSTAPAPTSGAAPASSTASAQPKD